jgi:hypothetical protein
MKEYFIDVLLVSLWASLLGNFWVLCLKDNMIFGKIGFRIRYRVECESGECDNVKDLCFWTKLLKGLECPFCVSIWMLIVMHTIYYLLFIPAQLEWYLWIALLLLAIGVTTLFNKIQTVFINSRLPF